MNWLSWFKRRPAAIKPVGYPNPFAGKRLAYLIGADSPLPGGSRPPSTPRVVEVGYDASRGDIAYCNLFNEKYSEQSPRARAEYGPYLHGSDTAKEYGEGQIDPTGPGWTRNLLHQFMRRHGQGFKCVELDNADAYPAKAVLDAYQAAAGYGFQVIAKNPIICENGAAMLTHPAVVGTIVEKECGWPTEMDLLRKKVGKPELPVWFVCFDKTFASGPGWLWGHDVHRLISDANYANMFATWSRGGEYVNAIDY